ncbi:hypothetical protein GCM10027169_12850 [Gordonia jinhuaensis]|uniref:CCHC-type domain-containing protein n=1 Tax=Gordonia jinhuaensis TaxID=1517702 RepID=A0A916WRC0_9ACTN|nr:hypothetical protein [Gordonia jinhuaensis]GGB22372.1 hypothetical protein GCM10011489_08190 [Gordonia jinhuaensis]
MTAYYYPPRTTLALVPECGICGVWGHHTDRCPELPLRPNPDYGTDPWEQP